MHKLNFFLLMIIFTAVSVLGQTGPVVLDSLISEALKNNPQLKASRYKIKAAASQIPQVSAWDAPQIGAEFYQSPIQSFPNPFKDQMEYDYFIQQMLPFPAKLAAMKKIATNNADMTEQSYIALEKKIIRALKSAYYELYLVQHKISINAENQALMEKLSEIASSQYKTGMGKQSDVLRAQTEISVLINEGINLMSEKRRIEAMINTILSRPVDASLGNVFDLEISFPDWNLALLQPLALASRSELKAMNYGIAMSKAELSLSRKEYFPDLMVRVMYKDMAATGNDFWSAMVGINVPLAFWSSKKYTAKVEENEANVNNAEYEYESMKNMILFEVQEALIKVQTNQNLVLLYKNTVIPQAEQTLQATIAAYQTYKLEFLMLIDAYRTLLMAKQDYYVAIMNYLTSQAQLEQAVGLGLNDIIGKIN